MEFKRFEALIEMFPQVQIFSTEGEDLDRVITHFLNQQKNVSTMSEAMQRKIQHALAPFFQQRFISLHDEEAPLVRHLLLKKKFWEFTYRAILLKTLEPSGKRTLPQMREILCLTPRLILLK